MNADYYRKSANYAECIGKNAIYGMIFRISTIKDHKKFSWNIQRNIT